MDCIFKNDSENFSKSLLEFNNSCFEEVRIVNDTLPLHLRFNENTLRAVLIYSVLFVIAAVGNLTVFISLFKSRHRKSRISLMIRHLAVADLFVTFVMIPIEIAWRMTVQWTAGNLACKVFLFLRAFGLYLSSNVLVCVSVDRYFAILHPLRVNDARRRGKCMLAYAWGISVIYSAPQSFIFHVATHPEHPTFSQCVSFGFFSTEGFEIAYNVFCLVAMYFVPLLVIIVAYSAILWEISNKSKETKVENQQNPSGKLTLRRSDISNIARARRRTLKMTITIVVVFVFCWTPYVVMTLWYMFDRTSAEKLPTWLQDALFMMAVSNSCMNPMVYGSYAINFRKECYKCFCCITVEEPTFMRKSTDAEVTLAAAGQPGLARRVIKCVLGLNKVRSDVTTRSTCTPLVRQVVENRSLRVKANFETNEPVSPKKKFCPNMPRPMSISMLPRPPDDYDYTVNFHSDPLPCEHQNNGLGRSTLESIV